MTMPHWRTFVFFQFVKKYSQEDDVLTLPESLEETLQNPQGFAAQLSGDRK